MVKAVLLHLLERYFHHRWLYLVPILVTIIAAGVYVATLEVDYTVQGVIYVNNQSLLASLTDLKDSNSSYWVTPAQATANELGELMKTDSFSRAIIQHTDLEKKMSEGPGVMSDVFTYIRKQVWATTLGDNQVQISAADPNPVIAQQLVSSLIENYIQWKMNSKKAESQAALDFFSSLITQYKANLDSSRNDLEKYVSEHPEPIRGSRPYLEQFEIDRLNGPIKIAEDRYTSALDKEENAKLSLQQIESDTRQTYILIDAPAFPAKPDTSLKRVGISMGIFLAVGIILTIALIVVSYLLDRTVHFSLDVSTQLNLPVLAMIPDTAPQKTPLFALPMFNRLKE